jgi:hypothetical protein
LAAGGVRIDNDTPICHPAGSRLWRRFYRLTRDLKQAPCAPHMRGRTSFLLLRRFGFKRPILAPSSAMNREDDLGKIQTDRANLRDDRGLQG